MLLCCQVFNEFNELLIIFLKNEEQRGSDCVIPRWRYDPKGVSTSIFFSELRLMNE